MTNWVAAEAALGVTFNDRKWLITAFTHRSYRQSRPATQDNEILEFTGDAVMALAVKDFLVVNSPASVDAMAARCTSLITNRALVDAVNRLQVVQYLRVGRQLVGNVSPRMQADLMEAIIGAVYRDQGLAVASECVVRWIVLPMWQETSLIRSMAQISHPARIRVLALRFFGEVPELYVEDQSDHPDSRYSVAIMVGETVLGVGSAPSLRRARNEANSRAIQALDCI